MIRNFVPWVLKRFRPFVAKIEKMTRSQDEEREMELERNARFADLEVVVAKLERDTQTLEQRLSAAGSEAERHAKDLLYLRQRQKTPVFKLVFENLCVHPFHLLHTARDLICQHDPARFIPKS